MTAVCRRLLIPTLVLCSLALAQSQSENDVRRSVETRAKMQRGELLTEDEQRFLAEYSALRQKQAQEFARTHAPTDSTGQVPLTDLGKGTYKGEQGGLFPGGENGVPSEHLRAGLAIARTVEPLDARGGRSVDGKIVFLSVGMSNTTQEFRAFMQLAAADSDVNERLVLVDGAQGAHSAEVTSNRQSGYWRVVDERLSAAGVTAQQVQVAWIKQTIQQPSGEFPLGARTLQRHLIENLHILKERFSNLKIAYVSSRIYAGYARTPLSPEPYAYEDGFAVKWLIRDQMTGSPDLNYDPSQGVVQSPWLTWGPYLWADGMKGRRDGLMYTREELAQDGVHPSMIGREKVAKLLLSYLKAEPTARPWFLGRRTEGPAR